jgi:hypothetical protein
MWTAEGINAVAVMELHDALLLQGGVPRAAAMQPSGAWHWAAANHRFNALLWDEEDKARSIDADPSEIARCKQRIDRYNQQRNDAVEAFDECLLAAVGDVSLTRGARLHSETAGAMVDRLSILSLKIFHMGLQAHRKEAGPKHVSACTEKLERLLAQRRDLASCLDRLLADVCEGRAYFKLYRQFKMYNDPALNPYLYGRGAVR